MTEWILSSSILILVVIGLRTVLKGRISLRLQYALWSLVLLRLLIPVSFGSSSFSVANLTEQPAQEPVLSIQATTDLEKPSQTIEEIVGGEVHLQHAQGTPVGPQTIAQPDHQLRLRTMVPVIWSLGFICVAGLFLAVNHRFRRKLMSSRVSLDMRKNGLDVYVSGEIDTPCLFGIRHPGIYVTCSVAEDPTLLRHTLEHEATHCRHGDHIWSVLRCVCLAIHWYNPLVWWAAFLSRQDGELACDEATIRRLGEGERAEYGRTLIGLTCQKKANVLITATTMNSGKSSLRERIVLIAKKPKMAVYTLIAVVLIAAVAVGCTFTGAKKNRADAYEKLPEYLENYSYEQVKERMDREEVRFLGSVEDYALVYCSGTGPTLTLYRYEIDRDQIVITEKASGDYAISGGLSVNHLVDGDKHIYFGTVSDYHWIPEDDTRIPLEWKNLVFWDSEGNQKIVNFGENGYVFTLDSPISDFWVAVNGGNVALKMEEYLAQGYRIHEVCWVSQQSDTPQTLPTTLPTEPNPTELPDNATPVNIPELLHEEADPEKICIGILPTTLSTSYADFWYIIPENQELLLEYFEAAEAKATELQWDSDIAQSGWVIEYQGQCWWAMEDGSFRGDRTIGPDDAKTLYDICREEIKEAGFGNPVRPQDITGIISATLSWNGGTTIMDPDHLKGAVNVTEPYILKRLEALFSDSRYYGSVQCPFGALLELTLENGETLVLSMATDSCASWMSEGMAYGYGEMTNVGIEGNEEFYSFFLTDIIHEKAQEGPEAMTSCWPYIHWGIYANKYGHEETLKLLYMFEDYLLSEPTDGKVYLALTAGRGLDGAYAEFYSYLLGRLFEAAPADFNLACRQMVPEKYVEEAVMHLAFYWEITPEEARAKLEAAENRE